MRYFLTLLLCFAYLGGNAQNFEPSWEEAKEKAKTENKTLLLIFSGSDWCIPCIKLEKEVWKESLFQSHAKKNYVLYRADFPKRKKNQLPQDLKEAHAILAEQYNPEGYFPYVVVFDEKIKIKGYFGYEKKETVDYIKQIDAF